MKPSTASNKFVLALSALLIACLYLPACGGGGGGGTPSPDPPDPPDPVPPAVTVVVGPSSTVVQPGATQQFDATVSNATNTAVTWSVEGETGGNATVGTISNSGLYTAPDTVPTPDTLTITATSQQDSSKTGATTVTIVSLGSGVNDAC